ncbi:hypothetical protein VHEMI08512 [[Torrubiella] hemipterigena]|uniref:Uncharacterized protein n=1 Tax=[Torrubiella] hemipterigena TaxID=1531966 RepID=A0A0A1TNA6_9HYPO|nr:hypothetical protein VHEMI08512 [[Torrubiella] hemipterigena]
MSGAGLAVVAISFDLAAHAKATASPEFMDLVELTKDSPGRSIYTVLHTPIKDLLVIFPTEKRAFLMGIFNIDVYFGLSALVSDILITHGLPGERLPPELIAHIKGDANPAADSAVDGRFQFYCLPAAQHDASTLHEAPLQSYAWGEMPVSALHLYQAKHASAASILIAGPKAVNRSWGGRWSNSTIRCDMFLKKEFTSAEAEEIWTEIQGQAKELTA